MRGIPAQAPYSVLPRFYDRLAGPAPAMNRRARRKVLGRILADAHVVCDLGCGTGSTALELARAGKRVYALDYSPGMVRAAREKLRRAPRGVRARVRIGRGDLRRFRLPEPVDLVLSEFNPVNHLPRKSDLARAARAVFRALRPGGHFCFDLNTVKAFRQQYPQTRFEDRGDFAVLYQGGFNPKSEKGWLELQWFIHERGRWRRYRERMVDITWSDAEIRAVLRRAGFRRIRRFDGADVRPPSPHQRRGYDAYYLAQKPL